PEARFAIQRIMTTGAGVLRSAESLAQAAAGLDRLRAAATDALEADGKTAEPGTESWEATNLWLVARVLVAAALRREETRGCHWREDFPDRADTTWRRHLLVSLRPDRTLEVVGTDSAAFPAEIPQAVPTPAPAVLKETP
ncbi:L-aspartate oxidase, partial [Streptomyces sp. UNOC14_S4]|nr:L-aspartate oxidase [Streptomyces sp. UNOC14_S4]